MAYRYRNDVMKYNLHLKVDWLLFFDKYNLTSKLSI